jgi:hypothetical protein
MLGIGTMLHQLGGGSENSASKYYGRKIKAAEFRGDAMRLTFEDGVTIVISDQGQSCCESRYMTCDDNPSDLIGQELRKIEVKSFDEINNDYDDCHEIAFLEIGTDQTSITFATHNEHNGYYGGFGLNISEVV